MNQQRQRRFRVARDRLKQQQAAADRAAAEKAAAEKAAAAAARAEEEAAAAAQLVRQSFAVVSPEGDGGGPSSSSPKGMSRSSSSSSPPKMRGAPSADAPNKRREIEAVDEGEFNWSQAEVGRVVCRFSAMTHIGGAEVAQVQKQNQDAAFVARVDAQTIVFGVLDGHGSDNGQLVAQVGASTLRQYFLQKATELTTEKAPAAMKAAFKVAHKHMRRALEKRYEAKGEPLTATPEGFLVESDGQPCDGGATATVAALIEGHLLIVANVGDSDCVIGGALPDAPLTGCSDAEIGFDQLWADHTPTNGDEFIRVHNLAGERPDGWEPANFVYDTSGSEYDAEARGLLEIFAVTDDGNVDLADVDATLTECDVGYKSKRGDRPTALLVPEGDVYASQQLGITRSLGDFYLQYHGVSWEPAVSCIDLFDVQSELRRVTLVLASDGLWDLWGYQECLEHVFAQPPPTSTAQVKAACKELIETTRVRGEEIFGESADNITTIVVTCDLEPAA